VHNLGKFDIYFILNVICNSNKYEVNILSRDDLILSIVIQASYKVEVNNKKGVYKEKTIKYSIKLVDSYNILAHKLSDLCRTFDTDTTKDIFPYKFININKLFYISNKPDISYYNPDVDINLYNQIPSKWDYKLITLDYLEKDLIALYEVMSKFSEYIFINYSIQVRSSITITSLALKIHLSTFYNKDIPLINKNHYIMI